VNGGMPDGDNEGLDDEPMSKQLEGWGDKLWWVHSEALYTTLRCYFKTGDERYLEWHKKVFEYVYHTFPNNDPEVREWIQIQTREGQPEDKVVALPVKDPYHVMRNLCLIIELLYQKL
jgi:N-acylglucosamine 2-epimerase